MLAVPFIVLMGVLALSRGESGGWWLIAFAALVAVLALYNAFWDR